MTELHRTATGGFDVKDAVNLDRLTKENIADFVSSEEDALKNLKQVFVTEKQAVRFSNGGQLSFERLKNTDFKDGELLRIKYKNTFLGVGYADNENSQIAIKCVVNQWSVTAEKGGTT